MGEPSRWAWMRNIVMAIAIALLIGWAVAELLELRAERAGDPFLTWAPELALYFCVILFGLSGMILSVLPILGRRVKKIGWGASRLIAAGAVLLLVIGLGLSLARMIGRG